MKKFSDKGHSLILAMRLSDKFHDAITSVLPTDNVDDFETSVLTAIAVILESTLRSLTLRGKNRQKLESYFASQRSEAIEMFESEPD